MANLTSWMYQAELSGVIRKRKSSIRSRQNLSGNHIFIVRILCDFGGYEGRYYS